MTRRPISTKRDSGCAKPPAQGARLVALPEVFIWRGEKKREREFAETIPGPSSTALAGLARELRMYLLAGSILEAIPGSDKAYNTSLLFDPAGELIASYRKIHLFDVDLANGTSLRESATREYGDGVIVADTEFCPMGLTVCYDLRFPELYRALAIARRADHFRALRFYRVHRRRALGDSAARPRDRESSLYRCRRSVRQEPEEL